MGLEFDFSKLDAMDILDIAIYVEREAEANYDELSVWCRNTAPEAESFFKRMAGWEARHEAQLVERRQALFGDAPVRYTDTGEWQIEKPDFDKVGGEMTLMDALEVAFEAERTAERYYEAAVEYIDDDATVAMLHELRESEVQHQQMLKTEMAKYNG